MNDYFKDICDWRDESDKPPRVYLEFNDVLDYKGHRYRYYYIEREWKILRGDASPSKRCCEILIDQNDLPMRAKNWTACGAVWGGNYEEALQRMKTNIDFYLQIKDFSSYEEYKKWRDSQRPL